MGPECCIRWTRRLLPSSCDFMYADLIPSCLQCANILQMGVTSTNSVPALSTTARPHGSYEVTTTSQASHIPLTPAPTKVNPMMRAFSKPLECQGIGMSSPRVNPQPQRMTDFILTKEKLQTLMRTRWTQSLLTEPLRPVSVTMGIEALTNQLRAPSLLKM